MKPVRFFTDQQTVWYNLFDYIQLLLDTQTIHEQLPSLLHKRKRPSKSIYQVLGDKVNRLNPAYHRQWEGAVYVDWAVFENLYRLVRPFLVKPDDWSANGHLFRQLQLAIEHSKRLQQGIHPETMINYFTEVKNIP
jgi:hypothetical protein